MLKSADGGKTWQRQNAEIAGGASIVDMQFLDENVGFLLVRPETGKSQVLRTMDGGKGWKAIGAHHAALAAMSFVDPNHGWVVGDGGCIFHYDLGPLPAK